MYVCKSKWSSIAEAYAKLTISIDEPQEQGKQDRYGITCGLDFEVAASMFAYWNHHHTQSIFIAVWVWANPWPRALTWQKTIVLDHGLEDKW